MDEPSKRYNELLSTVHPHGPIADETLSSPDVVRERDILFDEVRHALEPTVHARVTEAGLRVWRRESKPNKHMPAAVWEELGAVDDSSRAFPIAFAVQTQEGGHDIVRFGVRKVTHLGAHALSLLNEEDDGLERIIFGG